MFGLSKRERAAFEEHIASLNEQIHWLRSCIPWVVPVGPAAPVAATRALGSEPPVEEQPFAPLHMTEEEEDVQAALERGDIDVEEAKAILQTLGLTPEIEFN